MERQHLDAMKNIASGEIDFLRAEAQTGLTFAKIALSSRHQDKIARNRANARKAYDTLVRFLPQGNATPEGRKEVKAKIAELKSLLQQLGEDI